MSQMATFVETHKGLIAGGFIVVAVVGYAMTKKGTSTTATGQQADLTGLKNGLVYVPTSTNFTTENQSGIFASNDPNLTSVSNSGPINSPTDSTTTTTNNGATGKPIVKPPRKPPVPTPPPPTHKPPTPPPTPPATGGGLLGPGIRFFPNYKDGRAYYRGPSTGGQIILIPLPANTTYQPGANGRVWYQSPPGSPGKLLTSGNG
jgi:hypothetical protein